MEENKGKTIREMQKEVHALAIEKGWWKEGVGWRSVGDQFANFHAEISEAWEEYRRGGMTSNYEGEKGKPEGVVIELADTVIRMMDTCEAYGLDMQAAIEKKHEFNKGRAYRHGNKLA